MSSDVTEWHDVAAGRGSLCNWIMEGASNFSEFDNLGEVLVTPTPTHALLHQSKGVYLQNVVLKFSGSE